MKQHSTNPNTNIIPDGIKETALIQAIEMSGYPLQGVVASKLKQQFGVTEEWGYIDRDSKEHRSLDIFAFKSLSKQNMPVQPSMVLLIECKRTAHPYVFFQNVIDRSIPRFPYIAGMPQGSVPIMDIGGHTTRYVSGSEALGLNEHPFIESGPPICAVFSKAVPKGDKVRLSGEDPFNSLILPLVKAFDHASQLYKANSHTKFLRPTLIFCVSVLDAPMILVESPSFASEPILIPWVRIVRQEANSDRKRELPFRFYAIDAVHIDFFDSFVNDHFIPFAQEFGNRAVQYKDILHGGKVQDIENWRWNEIQPR